MEQLPYSTLVPGGVAQGLSANNEGDNSNQTIQIAVTIFFYKIYLSYVYSCGEQYVIWQMLPSHINQKFQIILTLKLYYFKFVQSFDWILMLQIRLLSHGSILYRYYK